MRISSATIFLYATCFGSSALAALSPEEIAQLGNTLTPWGAVQAGNADGSIPAYRGGLEPPAGYDPASYAPRPDPFAGEKPLFSVTAQNMDQHADKLSEGAKALLRKYPETYRLDIYPTHRTANYPQYVLDNTLKNAKTCELADNLLQLAGDCYGGVPFPIPKSGSQVMWNQALKFDQYAAFTPRHVATLVDSSGRMIETGGYQFWQTYPLYDPARTEPIGSDDILEYGRVDWTDPARKTGEKLVLHDSVDMLKVGRRSWMYLPGQRRVKLSPDVAYDTPVPAGGGVGTVDETRVFYGSQDRYDFELIGKKEIFIPYNTFKLDDPQACPREQLFTPNHLNPDCVRWELHRVWVVEAHLKEGQRHIYPRRTFYWDEDIPAVGMADNYDKSGNVYRFTHSLYFPFYETEGHNTQGFVTHDLASGAYVRQAEGPMVVTEPLQAKPSRFYQSSALSSSGVR